MRTMPRSLLAATVLAAVAGSAQAHIEVYTAVLSGPAESPPNAWPGTGFATVTLDLDLATMRVEASFTGLTGNTSASHIHGATAVPGVGTAGVMTTTPSFTGFPLGVTSGSYDHLFDLTLASSYNPSFITANGGTVATAMNAMIFAIQQGRSYLNIHTNTFPGGEIRGFLVPAPGAAGLALVVGGLMTTRRRRV